MPAIVLHPYARGNNYGVHPAVRIHYSPELVKWLEKGRPEKDSLPDGAIIVKEMFPPPAAIYHTIAKSPFFAKNPKQYEALLAQLMSDGWTVMIKDSKGDSKDGWFWAAPGIEGAKGNVDDFTHVPTSGFGSGTCIRCHASAESENTFSSKSNYDPKDTPLQFRVDNSWRSETKLKAVLKTLAEFPGLPRSEYEQLKEELTLPAQQMPWTGDNNSKLLKLINPHAPDGDLIETELNADPLGPENREFVETFSDLTELSAFPSAAEMKQFASYMRKGDTKQNKLLQEFMEATDPDGVEGDPDYTNRPASGADHLKYKIALAGLDGAVPAKV